MMKRQKMVRSPTLGLGPDTEPEVGCLLIPVGNPPGKDSLSPWLAGLGAEL